MEIAKVIYSGIRIGDHLYSSRIRILCAEGCRYRGWCTIRENLGYRRNGDGCIEIRYSRIKSDRRKNPKKIDRASGEIHRLVEASKKGEIKCPSGERVLISNKNPTVYDDCSSAIHFSII